MSITNEDVQCLHELGLTILQAKVYLTLLKTDKTTVKNIASESKIARQEIYRVLSEIEELGIIEKILALPTKYKGIPLCDTISFLMKRRNKKTQDIEKIIKKVIRKHKNDQPKNFKQEDFFILIPKKERFVKKLKQLITQSKKSVKVITAKNRLINSRDSLKNTIIQAGNRGVNLQLITEKDLEEKVLQDYWPEYKNKVRYVLKTPPVVMAIIDNKEVLLITSANSAFANSSALWSNNYSQVTLAINYFEIMWLSAIDYPLKNQNYLGELAEEKYF